jgi:flagellar P-ring protein FlgI
MNTRTTLVRLCLIALSVILVAGSVPAQQQVKVKDVASITGLEDLQVYGYGLVVGLAGTGDRSQTVFTAQTVMNMLKNMGVELPEKQIRVQNVAAVIVTATMPPFKRKGTKIDVTVSSVGDATSLEGGTLVLTPLQGPESVVYASAQGPLATGGYDIEDRGLTHIKKNHVLVGRIPDGGVVQHEYDVVALDKKEMSVSLFSPDFTSAVAMARAINDSLRKGPVATPLDAATISLNYGILENDTVQKPMSVVEFIAKIENVNFDIASTARVVMNERTGTIVAGGDVRISEVAVTHGGVKVEIVNTPEVVQPQPFSLGRTEVIPYPESVVEEKDANMVVLKGTTSVTDLAHALNSLGVSPRDVISIFQAIKEAGALHGQLTIM